MYGFLWNRGFSEIQSKFSCIGICRSNGRGRVQINQRVRTMELAITLDAFNPFAQEEEIFNTLHRNRSFETLDDLPSLTSFNPFSDVESFDQASIPSRFSFYSISADTITVHSNSTVPENPTSKQLPEYIKTRADGTVIAGTLSGLVIRLVSYPQGCISFEAARIF